MKTTTNGTRLLRRIVFTSIVIAFLIGSLLYFFEPWNSPLYNYRSIRTQSLQEKSAKLRQRSSFHLWTENSPEWLRRTYVSKFLFVFYDGDLDSKLHHTVVQTLKTLSLEQRRDAFSFVAVPSRTYIHQFQSFVDDEFETHLWPAALILDVGVDVRKYALPLGDLLSVSKTEDDLSGKLQALLAGNFLSEYEKGYLQRYLRNEAIAIDDSQIENHGLISINSTRFQSALLGRKGEKEFFLTFYAPWCGHCRRFEAAFNPIAKVLRKHTSKIGFYKMDATKNDVDHPAIEFNRVPHSLFLSVSNKFAHPLAFDPSADELTLDYVKAYLKKHSMYYDEIKIAAVDEL